MPLNDAALNVGANSLKSAITHLSLHTALPDATGSNQSAAARKVAGWGTVATGDFSTTNIAFTGGAANGPVTHVGYWSAITAGTFYGYEAITGDATFNSAGEYTLTSASINS